MRFWIFPFILIVCTSCTSWKKDRQEKAELLLRIGSSHFASGQYPLALSTLLEAEKLDPENPVIQNNLGLTYFMRQRYDLAQNHLRRALSLNKNFSDARNNLSRVLIELNQYSEAEKEIRIVLADLTYTGTDRAYVNLGLSQFNRKDWKNAQASFEKSLASNRENCIAATYIGRCEFEREDYTNATTSFDRAISLCQKQLFDEPHYFSALTWYRLGQTQQSLARFEEVAKLYPDGAYREKARAMIELIRKGGK